MREQIIELASFQYQLPEKVRLNLAIDIINNSKADILIFSGHTIGFLTDIEILKKSVKNSHTEVLFELENINSDKINNCLYRFSNGKLINMYTNQLFSTSGEIEGNYELADRLVHELETRRYLNLKGLRTLVLQCGELNILRNYQSLDNKVEFRFEDDRDLKTRFSRLLSQTDIVINPIHSVMGNQGKMSKRRAYLSRNNRCYFSTSNTKEDSDNLKTESLQYAYCNGKPLNTIKMNLQANFVTRLYKI